MSVGARGYYPITDRRYGCVISVSQLQRPFLAQNNKLLLDHRLGLTAPLTSPQD
jgi:hypothetical protein